MGFWETVVLHVIVVIPPTIAAIAALVTALHAKRNTQQIMVSVNGRIDQLQSELEAARIALAQRRHENGA